MHRASRLAQNGFMAMDDPTPNSRAGHLDVSGGRGVGLTTAGITFPATIANATRRTVARSGPAPAGPAPRPAPAPAPAPAGPAPPFPPGGPQCPAPAPTPADRTPLRRRPPTRECSGSCSGRDPTLRSRSGAGIGPGRQHTVGGFSYVLPPGWVVGDASKLNYRPGAAVQETGPAVAGQPAQSRTGILLPPDLKLFCGRRADNAKTAVRLASDMGEFFMPIRARADLPGERPDRFGVLHEVKFTDTTCPNGCWAAQRVNAPRGQRKRAVVRGVAGYLEEPDSPMPQWRLPQFDSALYAAPGSGSPGPGSGRSERAGAGTRRARPAPKSGVPVPVAPENAPGMMPVAGFRAVPRLFPIDGSNHVTDSGYI